MVKIFEGPKGGKYYMKGGVKKYIRNTDKLVGGSK